MVTNAAAMLEEPTWFKINFYACLYYKLEFVNGEYTALFLYHPLFFLDHFVIWQ